MVRFEIMSMDLRNIEKKVASVINNKSVLPLYSSINFTVHDYQVDVCAMDYDNWLQISTKSMCRAIDGSFTISYDDLKDLIKLNGIIEFRSDDNVHINVVCGKRRITILNNQNVIQKDLMPPKMIDIRPVFTSSGKWLLDTIKNLYDFTLIDKNKNNNTLESFCFNMPAMRVEACDTLCIATRSIEENMKISDDKFLLHNTSTKVLKKVIDKKCDGDIIISINDKYIKIVGDDFVYVTKLVQGTYFDIERFMKEMDYGDSFVIDKEDILDTLGYITDVIRTDKNGQPHLVAIKFESDDLFVYAKKSTMYVLEKIDIGGTGGNSRGIFYMMFNPKLLKKSFDLIDLDNPICHYTKESAPLFIGGKEYNVLVLPVTNDKGNMFENMECAILEYKNSVA